MKGQRHAPAALYLRERPGTHCTGGWVGPRVGLDRCGKSRPPPSGFDPRTVQAVASRYTNYATRPTFACKKYHEKNSGTLVNLRAHVPPNRKQECQQMNNDIQKRQLGGGRVSSPLESTPDNRVGKKKKCGRS